MKDKAAGLVGAVLIAMSGSQVQAGQLEITAFNPINQPANVAMWCLGKKESIDIDGNGKADVVKGHIVCNYTNDNFVYGSLDVRVGELALYSSTGEKIGVVKGATEETLEKHAPTYRDLKMQEYSGY